MNSVRIILLLGEDKLATLDNGAFKCIENKNPEALNKYLEYTGATVCGDNPISVLLYMLPDNTKIKLLKYDTSGNKMKDLKTLSAMLPLL